MKKLSLLVAIFLALSVNAGTKNTHQDTVNAITKVYKTDKDVRFDSEGAKRTKWAKKLKHPAAPIVYQKKIISTVRGGNIVDSVVVVK
jgi:hypothetical protein